MSQDGLRELIDILANSTSQDSNISNPANEAISEKINNDGSTLIINSAKILMNESRDDEKIKKAQTVASSILSQMLNISSRNDLEFNRQNLSPEIVEAIKNSLKTNIFSDDTTIRDNCCKTYSFLFATLTTNWKDGIDYIVNSFSNTDLLPNGFINLFLIMRNIVNQINFADEIINSFNQQFIQALSTSLTIISKPPTEEKYTATLRSSCVDYISDLINNTPEVIQISKDDTTSNITILAILNSLSNSFQIYDSDLYTSIQLLLLNLIQKFYQQSPSFMEQIVNYIDSGIDLASTHPKCSMISINFWKQNHSSDNLHILLACTNLLYNLSNVWKDNAFESRIGAYFDQIYNVSNQLFKIGIQNEKELLIRNSAESLNNLIYKSAPDVSNKLREVYIETLKNIDSSNDLKCSQNMRYIVVSQLFSHLSILLFKMRKSGKLNQDTIEEFAPKTIEVLFNILGTKEINIYKEGLMAISALINSTNSNLFYVELFTPETFNRLITEFVYKIFSIHLINLHAFFIKNMNVDK